MKGIASGISRSILLFCVICLLSVFTASKSIADSYIDDSYIDDCYIDNSCIEPTDKPAQTPSESKKIKLAELVQRLEAANPWTVEKVSEALGGINLTLTYSNRAILSYTANNLVYGDNLLIDQVEFRLSIKKDKMFRLILDINENSKCITFDHLEKMYPDIYRGPHSTDDTIYYRTKRSWGHMSLGFNDPHYDCLVSIAFIPEGEE